MMNRKQYGYSAWAPLLLMLTACGTSPPTRLYVLEPVAVRGASEGREALRVAVNEATLPKRLARKEILSRDQHFVIRTAEFDRWAEPLEQNVTSVLAENLSVLLGSDRVFAYPWGSGEPVDFTVSIQILEFGPDPSGNVALHALWRIANAAGDTVVLKKSLYAASRAGDDVSATVAAMSRAIGELSRDIADSMFTAADS